MASAPLLRAGDIVIENGNYKDAAAAQAVWSPMKGSAPVTVAIVQQRRSLRLPCNFAGTTFERASWDRKVTLDLSAARGIQFDVFCPDLAPASQFSLYFQSGAGWYSTTFHPETAGAWCTVTINKSALRPEGQPAGWGRISTLRISAWRGQNTDTELCLTNLHQVGVIGVDASVAIIRAESAARTSAGEARSVEQFVAAVADGFEAYGIGCTTPSDLELSSADLRGARLVVLPHNPVLSAESAQVILDYLARGGRLLVFYHLPPQLRAAVEIEAGRVIKADAAGRQFSAIAVNPGALPGAPARTQQKSWNVFEAKPKSATGRVVADWLDEQGRPMGQPAIIATKNCVMMTHVLLTDDLANKRRLLLAMAGLLVPEFWSQAATTALANVGRIGGSRTFDAASGFISQQAGNDNARANAALADARAAHAEGVRLKIAGKFIAAVERAPVAAQHLMNAYCLAQKPLAGEFRAFWCHSAFGVDGMEWDEAIKRLADAGFTAILPNMLWGGVAFYPSKVLPVAADVSVRGDQIAKCLAAGRKYGIQVHVWKVNWNTGHRVPAEFLERMGREKRLQMSSKGKAEPWLCPSHPENQALEIAAMVEVARDYDVDGIHFDYIRYPDGDHCFCDGCRKRFEKFTGEKIAAWPNDALAGGPRRQPWLEWRRRNITTVVEAVSSQARAVKPKIKISAAVFRNWVTDRDGVGQDWKLWCDRGWLDFVCPMNYTNNDGQFDTWIALQKEWAGKTPVYPGIGVSSSTSRLGPDRTIGQIEIARRHGTGGFTIFNYGAIESRELLPMLSLGITAAR